MNVPQPFTVSVPHTVMSLAADTTRFGNEDVVPLNSTSVRADSSWPRDSKCTKLELPV